MSARTDRRRPTRGRSAKPALPTGRGGWRAQLIAFGALMLLWVMVWGSVQPSLLIVGALSAAGVLWLFPLPHMEFSFGLHPLRAAILVLRFLWDVVASSLHVSWIAMRRTPPRSMVIRAPLATRSDLIQHLTSLAVSLVPGSLIIEAEQDAQGNRALLVHVLDVRGERREAEEHTRAQVRAQEARIAAAFGDQSDRKRSARGVR